MCYTFQLTAKRFPLTATQIVTEDVNSLCRHIHSPHKNPGILGLLTDLMGANYQCRPVSSQCCGLSPNLGFLTGMMPAPVYQHWATARTRSTGPPLSLRRRRPRPLFWPWVGGRRAFTFGSFECWVCCPDTSKCRGPTQRNKLTKVA